METIGKSKEKLDSVGLAKRGDTKQAVVTPVAQRVAPWVRDVVYSSVVMATPGNTGDVRGCSGGARGWSATSEARQGDSGDDASVVGVTGDASREDGDAWGEVLGLREEQVGDTTLCVEGDANTCVRGDASVAGGASVAKLSRGTKQYLGATDPIGEGTILDSSDAQFIYDAEECKGGDTAARCDAKLATVGYTTPTTKGDYRVTGVEAKRKTKRLMSLGGANHALGNSNDKLGGASYALNGTSGMRRGGLGRSSSVGDPHGLGINFCDMLSARAGDPSAQGIETGIETLFGGVAGGKQGTRTSRGNTAEVRQAS
ncbi:unnamed protein product [Ilex paraguariensis]|uniref:Uncharacterized protein n=1 Tax=Ilex paraguariensis TaxID=185542 RepID=A0ABC8TLX6_9AQUA